MNTFNNFFKTLRTINEVKRYARYGTMPNRFADKTPYHQNRFREIADGFRVNQGQLVFTQTGQRVVPPASKNAKLRELYGNQRDAVGLGVQGLYDLACSSYIGITKEDVKNFLMTQPTFQVTQDHRRPINKPTVALYPNHIWTIDYVDMGERYVDHGYRYILTCVDWFTKYCFAKACRTLNADELLEKVYTICYEAENVPYIIRCDNGGSFVSQQFRDWCNDNEVTVSYGTSYYPRSQSVVENFNRQLRKRIREGFVRNNTLRWTPYLDDYCEAWNRRKHSTTKYEPYFLYLVNDEDGELQEEVIERFKEKARRQVAKNETKELQVGDWVRVSMFQLSSAVRREFKNGNGKDVVVRWSPQKYQVARRIEPSLARVGLQKYEYELNDADGNPVLATTRPRRFFASDLMKTVEPSRQDREVYTQEWGNHLNRKALSNAPQLQQAQVRGGNRRSGNSQGNARVGNYDDEEEPLVRNRRNTRPPQHLSAYTQNLDLRRKNH